MERDGFVEYGGLATLDLFVGKLFVHYADSSENGNNLKTSFLSALPIFPLNGTHVWLNILLEYNLYSSTRSNYFFGVSESEAQSGRPAYVLDTQLESFVYFVGLWTPIIGDKWWLNLSYRRERMDNSVLDSPIVTRSFSESILAGLMVAF
jgi:outer membrane scaffolding protein for murein synthesis (MipA/OmpV family)